MVIVSQSSNQLAYSRVKLVFGSVKLQSLWHCFYTTHPPCRDRPGQLFSSIKEQTVMLECWS